MDYNFGSRDLTFTTTETGLVINVQTGSLLLLDHFAANLLLASQVRINSAEESGSSRPVFRPSAGRTAAQCELCLDLIISDRLTSLSASTPEPLGWLGSGY